MPSRRRMGMLFQFGALFTDLSVFDNVAFPLREHTDLSERLIRDIVLMKLNAVGLRGARDLMPSEVSGGMAGGWRSRAPSPWIRNSSCTTSRLPDWTRFRSAPRRA
jgi:ABC-type uncharacterized transport system YnjBCD ATPase subunit